MSPEKLAQLSEVYSKANLESGIFPFVKNFYLQQFFKMIDRPEIEAVLSKIRAKKPVNKTEMVLLSFSVFENKEIYNEFLPTLPNAIKLLIDKLLWVESVTNVEAEEILGESITTKPKY